MVRAFVHRQGADDGAVGDLRQPFGLLGVGAAQDQGRGGAHAGGDQGRGGQGPAHFLEDEANGQVAEGRAAVLLGDDHPGPAHLGHLVPGLGVVSNLDAGIAHLAEGGDRAFFLGPALRGVAEHALFFVQNGHFS